MNQEDIQNLQNITFKPLIYNIDGDPKNQHLIFIYSIDTTVNQSINSSGQREENKICTAHVWYIEETINMGLPIIDSVIITDVNAILKNVSEPSQDDSDELLLQGCETVIQHMNSLSREIMLFSRVLSAAKVSRGPITRGNLFIQGPNLNQNIAQVVFKTISGDELNMKKEEVEQVGETIGQIIVTHSEDNLDLDEKELEKYKKKLSAELEYKIIESLPNHLSAGDIKVDVETILEEIRKIQNHLDNGDENGEDEELIH